MSSDERQPIPDFPGFIAWMLATEGATQNPCRDHCQDKGSEHVHLRHRDGHDGIIWADGRVSEYDLTQPARLIYPAPPRNRIPRRPWSPFFDGPLRPDQIPRPHECYQAKAGFMVHVKPGCQCKP